MKLSELTNILQFDTDFADTEIDASFYTELEDIKDEYAKDILVDTITKEFVICHFYDFIQKHKEEITKYIKTVYHEEYIDSTIVGIFEDQDAECIAYFIENDMDDFLRGDY